MTLFRTRDIINREILHNLMCSIRVIFTNFYFVYLIIHYFTRLEKQLNKVQVITIRDIPKINLAV